MKKFTTLVAVMATMAMMVLPAVASAASGYSTTAAQVESTVQTTPKPAATESKGNLPFTGLEVSVVAIAGVALLGTGIALRKMGGTRHQAS